MAVKRIVPNIAATDLAAAQAFYSDIFGLELLMDLGWIQTFGAGVQAPVQLSVVRQDGDNAPVPDITIEVDDLESILIRVQQAGLSVEYGPVTEPWGVRRFFLRDPFGKLLNVMQHV